MPIENFSGETFVAFTDISGFKELMKSDKNALDALKIFYQSGYDSLAENPSIEGFFISDSGVLFSRNGTNEAKLNDLLIVIESINEKMLQNNYMLTTSIAYGNFDYHGKIEFIGIEKNPIYGGAYVHAFLDNETGTPRIQPGQCRVCIKNLPELDFDENHIQYQKFKKLKKLSNKHFQFYWNVSDENQITNFEQEYKNSYSLKYSGMLNALKRNI